MLAKRSTNWEHFFQCRYRPFSLNVALEQEVGEATLADLRLGRLLVPTVNLTDGKMSLHQARHLPRTSATQGWRLVEVIVASVAASTYLLYKTMPDGKVYADGGLWDPGFTALSEADRVEIPDAQGVRQNADRTNHALCPSCCLLRLHGIQMEFRFAG
ncbi:MAG: hypothetical protein VXZ82_19720 [Planctomycetota bacterium]|nr:hypothetical protein [Planctomycetota bacterium]